MASSGHATHTRKVHAMLVGVPARRAFEGRVQQLDVLLGWMRAGGDNVIRTAITGLGGIGKTAVAIEVAHRVAGEGMFTLIVWCNAATLADLDASLAAAADAVGAERAQDDAVTAQRVRAQLEARGEPWLLVLDNADGVTAQSALSVGVWLAALRLGEGNEAALRREGYATLQDIVGMSEDDVRAVVLGRAHVTRMVDAVRALRGGAVAALHRIAARVPASGRGCVLVTSRLSDLGALHAQIRTLQLNAMSPDDADALAAELSGQAARTNAPRGGAEAEARRRVAVEQLGGLPLAIEQAAAFVRRGASFVAWEARFARERTGLFGADHAAALSTEEAVHTTWCTSMALLRAKDAPLAVACEHVMRVLAVLAPDAIPHRVVKAACGVGVDAHRVCMALGEHSLVQSGHSTVSVHRLVQAVVRDGAGGEAAVEQLCVHAAALVGGIWPSFQEMHTQPAHRDAGHALLPHGLHMVDTYTAEVPEVVKVAVDCANTLSVLGLRGEAARVQRRLIAVRAALHGAEHLGVLWSKVILGQELREAGEYDESRVVLEDALAAMQRVLGAEHERTLKCMRHLADTLRLSGDHARAEELARTAVDALRRVAGEDAESTITAMDSLSGILSQRGKLGAAEAMQRRVLAVRTLRLGDAHPHTLGTLQNLASTLDNLERYSEAEAMYRRVIDGRERVDGCEHPGTNSAWFSLTYPLIDQRKFEEARGILQRLARLPAEQRTAWVTEQRIRDRMTWLERRATE